jgi:hypothetical protein
MNFIEISAFKKNCSKFLGVTTPDAQLRIAMDIHDELSEFLSNRRTFLDDVEPSAL